MTEEAFQKMVEKQYEALRQERLAGPKGPRADDANRGSAGGTGGPKSVEEAQNNAPAAAGATMASAPTEDSQGSREVSRCKGYILDKIKLEVLCTTLCCCKAFLSQIHMKYV